MSKTYETDDLGINNPSSQAWALAVYRLHSGDKPTDAATNEVYPQFSLDDSEIEFLLETTAFRFEGFTYYLPLEALASRILTDPTYALQISEESYSSTFRTPEKLAEALRNVAERNYRHLYPEELANVFGQAAIKFTPRF